MRVPKFLLPAPKKLDFGPKNGQIWPKTGIFGKNMGMGSFDPMPDQKTMWTSCLGGFSVMLVPKLLITPMKIRIFGQALDQMGQKCQYLAQNASFGPNLAVFGPKIQFFGGRE